MSDPKTALRDFLQGANGVNASALSEPFDTATDIQLANYEPGPDYPEIAVVTADPTVPNGGEMDVTAMDPGGGGAIQDVVYSVVVDCWAGTEATAGDLGWQTHPDAFAVELAEEVHQSCLSVDQPAVPDGYQQLSAAPPRDAHDTEGAQTEYRQQVICYLKTTHGP